MRLRLALFPPLLLLCVSCTSNNLSPGARTSSPGFEAQLPPLRREFRGIWVATVDNTDWPSRPGLSAAQQQSELLAIMNRAVALRMNAIVLQVRPACDAIYPSRIEPWSEYLTGQMGRSPQPAYDPLAFAVDAAHARGLELHAWFNPFRARHNSRKSTASPDHVSRKRPDLVRRYGQQQWLDPGDPAVQIYSLSVIRDVVRRYDVDGVHLDDYFYPYPERNARGQKIEFPDNPTYQQYTQSGGRLGRDDWRRANVDAFVERLYQMVKSERSSVKVGISPFGIWRPGNPPQIKGFDPYRELYADSRLWLARGWMDYCSPQLYWAIDPPAQSYPALLNWWARQNTRGRHLWPGNIVSKVGDGAKGWPASEIVNQIRVTRQEKGAAGNVLFSAKPLMENRSGVSTLLASRAYSAPALIPACSWLDNTPPAPPRVEAHGDPGSAAVQLAWNAQGSDFPRLWVLRVKYGDSWSLAILPGGKTTASVAPGPNGKPASLIALSAVDRCGNLSRPSIIR